MAQLQTKFDRFGVWDRPPKPFNRSYSCVPPSERESERRRLMLDGSDLSLSERLRYALGLLTPAERKERVVKSAQQLRRYLNGADPPLSVLVMVSAATGVPVAWLADGRPDIPEPISGGVDTPISFGVARPTRPGPGLEKVQEIGRSQRAGASESAKSADFGVPEAVGTGMAAQRAPVGLAWQINPDRLARAYEMALSGIAVPPGRRPDSRRLMQVTMLIYDQMTEDEAAPSEGSQ